jgi:hypothetical protein
MAKFIKEGELVEGEKCHVITRNYRWKKGLKKNPVTNKTCILYELDRNCSVKVTESVIFNSKKEEYLRLSKHVHNSVGDIIEGEAIQLYVDSRYNCLKFPHKEGVSHRHGAQIEDTKIRTVGRLKYSFKGFRKKIEELNSDKTLENKI